MSGTAQVFEGYSFRTSARFGSRVTVVIAGEHVSITGPRVSRCVYRAWIALQAVCLALVLPAAFAALLLSDPSLALVAIALLIAHGAIGGIGAGCLWELQNLINFSEGTAGQMVTFPQAHV